MANKEVKNEKVTVQSLLDSTLWHRDIEINAHEIVQIDSSYADELIKKGFCKPIKAVAK